MGNCECLYKDQIDIDKYKTSSLCKKSTQDVTEISDYSPAKISQKFLDFKKKKKIKKKMTLDDFI